MESRKPRFGENNRQAPTWANTKGGGLGGNAPGEAQARSTRGGVWGGTPQARRKPSLSGGERPRPACEAQAESTRGWSGGERPR